MHAYLHIHTSQTEATFGKKILLRDLSVHLLKQKRSKKFFENSVRMLISTKGLIEDLPASSSYALKCPEPADSGSVQKFENVTNSTTLIL